MKKPALQSFLSGWRNKITLIELIELPILSIVFWYFIVMFNRKPSDPSLWEQSNLIIGALIISMGSWLIYNLYIFLARIGGSKVDVMIWIIASLVTATYTFWAWSALDINRWIMAKLFYRGEAPVEYAWSGQSKLIHKAWRESQKAPARPGM